jgi:CheY-like chemotaxis protein
MPPDRLLVVDDDPDVRALVSLAAAPAYEVALASTAGEALEQARSFRPDVILLDVMMPGMDGRQTLQALRADDATARIPVVFITAGADRFDGPEYRALGALGVISKPFDPLALTTTLARMCHGTPAEPARAPFAALGGSYAEALPRTIAEMKDLAAGLAAGGWQRPVVESLAVTAHRMAGSAGLYGLDRVGAAASMLSTALRRILEDGRWPPSRPATDVLTLVRAVARAAPRKARRRADS